ncbi:hypothetical protein RRG08_007376 [Elysia crispata]|uniref:HBS1-like protein N-terminal domain-containing protein n=1 Tax=Elysia crispata TaxID=231223 RepID=A0AAE1E492_9GAST|nr:hypothetical protein RRG08_007376 [Elysia crispata]
MMSARSDAILQLAFKWVNPRCTKVTQKIDTDRVTNLGCVCVWQVSESNVTSVNGSEQSQWHRDSMSRHRMVRSMNYEDEYYDDEDEYSRSVEDNYCISPSTAAQFTWNREKNVNFASYMNSEEVIDEGDEEAEEDDSLSQHNSLSDSANSAKLRLSEIDQAKLNSCLEEARNILGESTPEPMLVEVIIENQFNLEAAVNQLLTQQDVPKPQREPRQRRNRSQESNLKTVNDSLLLSQSMKQKKTGCSQSDTAKAPDTNADSKLSQNLSSLAALVAQHSSQKMSLHSLGGVSSDIDHKSNVIRRLNSPKEHSEQSSKLSLASLIKAHSGGEHIVPQVKETKADKVAQPTLVQLAKVHKRSTDSVLKDGLTTKNKEIDVANSTGARVLTMSSLLQTLSLEGRVSNSKTKAKPSASSLDISLSSCLKISKPSKKSEDVFSSIRTNLKVNLKTLCFQESCFEAEVTEKTSQAIDSSLISGASTLGLVLCSTNRKRKLSSSASAQNNKQIKRYSEFTCGSQVKGKNLYEDVVLQSICPFDFGSMSPDDIVRQKQKQAFTRSDKEFTV